MTSVTIGEPNLHLEDPDLIGRRWRTGVLLLIVADASFVAALVFTYFYLRGLNTENAWLAPDQQTAPIWVSWLITGLLGVSALIFYRAIRSIQKDNERAFVAASGVAALVVLITAVVQFIQLATFPFGVGTSSYSSCLYVIAGANLVHLVLTLFLGVSMVGRGRAHIYGATSNWQPRIVGLWWGWVTVAGVATAFATSFIASPNS